MKAENNSINVHTTTPFRSFHFTGMCHHVKKYNLYESSSPDSLLQYLFMSNKNLNKGIETLSYKIWEAEERFKVEIIKWVRDIGSKDKKRGSANEAIKHKTPYAINYKTKKPKAQQLTNWGLRIGGWAIVSLGALAKRGKKILPSGQLVTSAEACCVVGIRHCF